MERIGGRVTVEARNGWVGFSRVHHVSTSGLIEAIGRLLAEQDQPTHRLPGWLRQVVAEGRIIDDERRTRKAEGR